MSETDDIELPLGWAATALGAIVEPRSGKADPQAVPNAKFIGMEQVEAQTMRLLGTVPAATMKSGANVFRSGDVLYGRLRSYLNKVYQPDFAGLCSGEFIVLPETGVVHGKFLKYRLNAGDFVRFASRINTGDRPRVDFDQIKTFALSLPPRSEQERIADRLDELLSDLDAGVAALERVRNKLKLYRAAVLKAAVEGALTAEWRKRHPQTEPASDLLKRILAERRRRWEEEQLDKFKEKGREPPKNWKAKYKEPVPPNTTNLRQLPDRWCWATVEQVSILVTDGDHNPPKRLNFGVPHLTAKNVRGFALDKSGCSYISSKDAERVFRRYRPLAGDLIITCVGTVVRGQVISIHAGLLAEQGKLQQLVRRAQDAMQLDQSGDDSWSADRRAIFHSLLNPVVVSGKGELKVSLKEEPGPLSAALSAIAQGELAFSRAEREAVSELSQTRPISNDACR